MWEKFRQPVCLNPDYVFCIQWLHKNMYKATNILPEIFYFACTKHLLWLTKKKMYIINVYIVILYDV